MFDMTEKPNAAISAGYKPSAPTTRVIITDVDIPFGSLVVLMVKLVFAAIPAAIVAGIFYFLVFAVILASCS